MRISEFFERERKIDDTWLFTVSWNNARLGLKISDVLTCSFAAQPGPADIVILKSHNCEPWPERFEEASHEIKNGAKVIGTVLLLSRDMKSRKA